MQKAQVKNKQIKTKQEDCTSLVPALKRDYSGSFHLAQKEISQIQQVFLSNFSQEAYTLTG